MNESKTKNDVPILSLSATLKKNFCALISNECIFWKLFQLTLPSQLARVKIAMKGLVGKRMNETRMKDNFQFQFPKTGKYTLFRWCKRDSKD